MRFVYIFAIATCLWFGTFPLQAKVDCIKFVYGLMPSEIARQSSSNRVLALQKRTLLYQYKLGTDLIIAGFIPPIIILWPLGLPMGGSGAALRALAQKRIDEFCKKRDCSCGRISVAKPSDYRIPKNQALPDFTKNTIKTKPKKERVFSR